MIRKLIEIKVAEDIIICFDKDNHKEIADFLAKNNLAGEMQKTFDKIIDKCITKHQYQFYKQHQVGAIKFKSKRANNARLYCKDYRNTKPRKLIICLLHKSKKQTELKAKELNLIKKVQNYEYE